MHRFSISFTAPLHTVHPHRRRAGRLHRFRCLRPRQHSSRLSPSPSRQPDANSLHLDDSSGSASRLGLSVRETPASVEILSQDAIQQRGARTFSEALRGMAGLSGGGPPSSPTTLSLRGFTSLMYLYDGVRSSGAGVTNRVQDTWNYEHIEVIKGPASVLDGEGAIGGTHFVTKRPRPQNQHKAAPARYGATATLRLRFGGDSARPALPVEYSRNDTKVGTLDSTAIASPLHERLRGDLGGSVKLDCRSTTARDTSAYWGTHRATQFARSRRTSSEARRPVIERAWRAH